MVLYYKEIVSILSEALTQYRCKHEMPDTNRIPLPISLNSVVFCFNAEELIKLNKASYACLIPELLEGPEGEALPDRISRKTLKGIILLTPDKGMKETWQSKLDQDAPFPLEAAGSINTLLKPEDVQSLANKLLFILENISRQKYFTIDNLCLIISRLTDTELYFLLPDKQSFFDYRTTSSFSLPFQDWAARLDEWDTPSGSAKNEALFQEGQENWNGYRLKIHNRILGYIYYKQKEGIRLLAPSQRNILNMHLMMAGMGEAYKLIRLKRHKEEFLYSVIYGLNKDVISLKNEASLYKIAFEELRYIWILKLEKKDDPSGERVNIENILSICEKAVPQNIFLKDGSTIVSIQDKKNESDESIAERMQDLIKAIRHHHPELHGTIGNSRAYANLFDLRHAYQDALFSLRIGRMIYGKTRNFVTYNDLLIYHFLYDQKENPIIRRLYTNSIEKLRLYDKNHKEDLLKTVKELTKQEFGISETARLLGLHRNTLYQRMEKIENLTGINLKSQEGRLLLQLGMKLDQILEVGEQSAAKL